MLLGQPVEEVSGVAGQDFIIVQCGDGLDALLQLLQAWLHTLHLQWESGATKLTGCRLPPGPGPLGYEAPMGAASHVLPVQSPLRPFLPGAPAMLTAYRRPIP